MFDEYPYTDLHNLNLDWFLDQFKKMGKHLADLKKMILSAPDATNANAGQAPIADGAGGWAWGDVQGGSVTVDSTLSTTSTNPVQNKVIKSALDGKASGTVSRFDTVSAIATQAGGTFKAIDKVVTNSAGQVTSVNLKTIGLPSGGGGSVTVDSALSTTSTNPVQNRVIKSALDSKASTAAATTTTAGLMSATDKSNLDTLMSDYQSASTALG